MTGDEKLATEESGSDPTADGAVDPVDDAAVDVPVDPTMSPIAARVFTLLTPVVATAGVELLDVEWTGGTLQVIVDHNDGVTLDQLASVNRLVSPILDQHDPVPGRYTLEVSSPGIERPLRRLEHYQRAVGEVVVVKTEPHVIPRRVKGTLLGVTETELSIDVTEVDGVDLVEIDRRAVAVADIASARTIFDWGPTPKKGGNQPKKGGRGAGHQKNRQPNRAKKKEVDDE